jgi:hypothetical protein
VRELSQQKEMLGSELRDVFDAHPPRPLAQPKQLDMKIFTKGKDDRCVGVGGGGGGGGGLVQRCLATGWRRR